MSAPASTTGRKVTSTATKAGLELNVRRVEMRLRSKNRGRKLEGRAAVYAAAVAQRLVEEVNSVAVAEAKAKKQKRVLPQDVQMAIRTDPDLAAPFADFSFLSGQVALPKASKYVSVKASAPRGAKKAAAAAAAAAAGTSQTVD